MARLFLSTDDNAPVLAGADRACVVDLLKKCLIEGYGDKQPVGGWTMPYSTADGRVGVFRNDHEGGGLGHYLRVGQDDDRAAWATTWNISAHEDMTSENDGVFPYLDSPFTFASSSTNNNVMRPWVFLASRTWLALFVHVNKTDWPVAADAGTANWATTGFWWGDIEKWHPDDRHHCMLSQVNFGNVPSFGSTVAESEANTTTKFWYRFSRKSDGAGGSPVVHFCHLPHPQSGLNFGADGPEYNASSGLLVARAAINDGASKTLRGWIPDMLVPLHPRPFAHLERVSIAGTTYAAVCFSSRAGNQLQLYGHCQALFALDDGE